MDNVLAWMHEPCLVLVVRARVSKAQFTVLDLYKRDIYCIYMFFSHFIYLYYESVPLWQ